MWRDLGASWAILLGIGFMMLANGLQGTLLGVRASIEGFSTFTTGIMMTGYFIGIFLGSMIFDGVFERHKQLRGACVELGAGWVPSWLRRLTGHRASGKKNPTSRR